MPEHARSGLALAWTGYLRVVAEAVENDPKSEFVGRNDGFKLANARIGLTAGYGRASLVVSLEAALGKRESFNEPNASFGVGPKDPYMAYDFSSLASLKLGRFHTPYDLGELEETDERTFIDAPLESRGVEPTLGFELDGLAQGRQLGVMLYRDRLGLSSDGFDLGYALALTNGRTRDLIFNDNDRVAGFARLLAHFGHYASLHLAGFADTRTVGELPNLFAERVKGFEASFVFQIVGLEVEAQLLFQRIDFLTSAQPRVDAIGFHAQWSYTYQGFTLAYRYAWYDPNLSNVDGQVSSTDAVAEHTLDLSYVPEEAVPLRFALDGTVAQEQTGRVLRNNRLALLAQFAF